MMNRFNGLFRGANDRRKLGRESVSETEALLIETKRAILLKLIPRISQRAEAATKMMPRDRDHSRE
jgi:hypothetical protein